MRSTQARGALRCSGGGDGGSTTQRGEHTTAGRQHSAGRRGLCNVWVCAIIGGDEGCAMTDNVNVNYKDTVFRLLFSDKERLLSLYNAMSDHPCDNIDDLKVVTLENAIYMEVKNDIAFLLGDCLHLWEHPIDPQPQYAPALFRIHRNRISRAHQNKQEKPVFKDAYKAPLPTVRGVLQRH